MSGPLEMTMRQARLGDLSPRFRDYETRLLRRMAVYNPVFMRVRRRVRALLAVMTLTAAAMATTVARGAQTSAAPGGRVVHPLFELRSPDTSPFPSDRFTVADDQNLTRRRVNLPLPSDCVVNRSDCEDVRVLNELDGFSTRPLVVIPFDGDIDPATVSGNVFFLALGDTTHEWNDTGPDSAPTDDVDREGLRRRGGFGRITGINQIVWDPATRVLHAKADRLLDEHTRYALVVTNGIRASTGQPIAPSDTFRNYQRTVSGPDAGWYRKALLAAEWAARTSVPRSNDIVAVSSFTTQSVTYLQEKITRQIEAAVIPAAPDFNIGPGGTRALFEFSRIDSITHNQQVSPTEPPQRGEAYSLMGTRWVPGAVGRIAFGRFSVPDYMAHPGEYIPAIRSRTGTPRPQGFNTLHFTLILPSGPRPANGWPVVVFGHGGNGTRATTPLEIASIPASHGLALLCIDNIGHGRGPASTLTLRMTDGSNITVSAPGRGIDQDADGAIGSAEGRYATGPYALAQFADAVTEISADHLSLVRLVERGIDADGDGTVDLDASRIYFLGQSAGAHSNVPFVVYASAVRASFFLVPPGHPVDVRRFSSSLRPALAAYLASRTPPLTDPVNGRKSIGSLTLAPPFFEENIPSPYELAVTNRVPGAMALQRLLDRIEWRSQRSDAVVFASRLRRAPPLGTTVRPTVIFVGRGDQSAPLVDSAFIIKEGALEDRTVLYRHDLVFAANPTSVKNSHTVYRFQGPTAPTNSITVAIQQQFSRFFASDGASLEQTSPYLETPMKSPLPTQLDFIP